VNRVVVGDRVRANGVVRTVVGLSGQEIVLAGADGTVVRLTVVELMAAEDFSVLGGARAEMVPRGVEDLPANAVEQARWWEGHILEVLRGQNPGSEAGGMPRPGYDPGTTTLASRERAKAAELSEAGVVVSARLVKHYRQRYQASGLRGLVDGRTAKKMPEFGRVDDRVVEAMRQAITEAGPNSTRTIGYICWRTGVLLDQEHGPGQVPPASERTLYRLFGKLSEGTATTGTARARRWRAARPDTPFQPVSPGTPGEMMQIDSTPLDVLVRLDDATVGAVELTAMVDVATRSITAAVLRPTTRAVDASVLLARTVTPEPMRPGWVRALTMERSVLPYRRLLAVDERIAKAAARPAILPATIVVDHGKAFTSQAFKDACRFLGINLQPARKAMPTDKSVIERTLGSVAGLFAQFVSGYTGSGVEHRGRKMEQQPLWSLPELQGLLDEWIIVCWQNRPHDALRDPAAPGRAYTPNERYAALVESAGYVPIALREDDYVHLLPACYRTVGAAGVRIARRTYDDKSLDPLRHRRSTDAAHKHLWEVRCDPYDLTRVWVRDPNGGWITAFWTHLRTSAQPFGQGVWDHVRAQLPDAAEQELADAAYALLERAHRGPPAPDTAKARRTVARDRAAGSIGPRPAPPAEPPEPDDEADTGDAVVPLAIFDPYREAEKRW